MPKIIIRIPREGGRVEIEAVGYKGKSCLDATKWLRAKLTEGSTKQKPEMFEGEKESEVVSRQK